MAFTYKDYLESEAVKKARQLMEQNSTYKEADAVRLARDAVAQHESNKVADWSGGQWGQYLVDTNNKINNREKFTYDLNADMLYQQYKDKYMRQGEMAMQNTMGQAAALTGGYGNSYAATVGNQAYQASLQNLNDIVPSLYQAAYERYNQEGQDLQNQFARYQSLYGNEYGEYRDKVNDWNTTWSRLNDVYNNERNFDYTKFNNNRDYYTNAYNTERTTDYGRYTDAYNRAFAQYQQQKAEEQAAAQLAASYSRGGSTRSKSTNDNTTSPKATANTSNFIKNTVTAQVYQHDGYLKGRNKPSYANYIKQQIQNWWTNGRLSDSEVLWLKNYYKI